MQNIFESTQNIFELAQDTSKLAKNIFELTKIYLNQHKIYLNWRKRYFQIHELSLIFRLWKEMATCRAGVINCHNSCACYQ